MMFTGMTRARASALLFGGAALCAITSPGRAQTTATIRVASIPIDAAAQVYYAKEMGFFAQAGIDVQIQTLPSGMADAVAGNAVDVGYVSVDTLVLAHQRKIPFVVIAPASEYISSLTGHIAGLVLPANSSISHAKDLSGKTIAAPLNTLAEYGTRSWIDDNGGDSSTVKFIDMTFAATPAALSAGRIDGAWETEPFLTVAKEQGRVLGYGFESIGKQFVIGAWFSTSQWAHDHPDLVSHFAAVMRDTAVWANKNHPQSGEILEKYAKIDPTVVATMTRSHYVEKFNVATMQPLIDVASKYNKIAPFPAQDLIYAPSR
jgi:NitT/TauT family transport system substrate-binding protein